MKERELREHATCNVCGRKTLASGLPLFWRVTVERFGVDLHACQRQDGLATFIGSTAIAGVMGPDEDLATPMMAPAKVTVCEPCMLEHGDRIMHAAFQVSR